MLDEEHYEIIGIYLLMKMKEMTICFLQICTLFFQVVQFEFMYRKIFHKMLCGKLLMFPGHHLLNQFGC